MDIADSNDKTNIDFSNVDLMEFGVSIKNLLADSV